MPPSGVRTGSPVATGLLRDLHAENNGVVGFNLDQLSRLLSGPDPATIGQALMKIAPKILELVALDPVAAATQFPLLARGLLDAVGTDSGRARVLAGIDPGRLGGARNSSARARFADKGKHVRTILDTAVRHLPALESLVASAR